MIWLLCLEIIEVEDHCIVYERRIDCVCYELCCTVGVDVV